MRTYIIDGSKFSDFEGFCCEIDRIMTKGLSFKTGHNLNAFRDILYGGLGCHEPEEPFVIFVRPPQYGQKPAFSGIS